LRVGRVGRVGTQCGRVGRVWKGLEWFGIYNYFIFTLDYGLNIKYGRVGRVGRVCRTLYDFNYFFLIIRNSWNPLFLHIF
jgi:hypothetical protein